MKVWGPKDDHQAGPQTALTAALTLEQRSPLDTIGVTRVPALPV
jgi:hypothetical protein